MVTTSFLIASICVCLVAASAGINDQIAFLEESNATILLYPTQFTQDIVPKRIHSHNDYWRDVPLLTALSYGATSVEADVWLVNGTLYVGHEIAALTESRTLDSLYISPLVEILNRQNPENAFNVNRSTNGVFDVSSGTSLHLFIDIKTDGEETFPYVVEALQPLRDLRYLTTFADGSLTTSAVTVIGTGNTPLQRVSEMAPRDIYFDAPLANLSGGTYDETISPIASTNYDAVVGWNGLGQITEAQLANITRFVRDAHDRGITARFWGTPGWPIQARNNVWQVLIENEADWLNADDLEDASNF